MAIASTTRHHVTVTNHTHRKELFKFGLRQTIQGTLLISYRIKTVFKALENVFCRGLVIAYITLRQSSGASMGMLRHSGDNVFAPDALNAKNLELLLRDSGMLHQAQCLRA